MKLLYLDIETRPILAYVWGIWQQNVGLNQIEEDWSILTWAAKWAGEDEYVYYGTAKGRKNDKRALQELWSMLDEADVVVAHNGERFDVPKINARFLKYGMLPPSPYKQIDTLKVARRQFKLTSNRLDYIAKYLGFEGKMETGGMDLWIRCMKGDEDAWDTMLEYNIKDVDILEWVYTTLRPWIPNHPNPAIYDDSDNGDATACPVCGGTHLHYRGFAYTPVGKYQRFVCTDCGKWGRLAINLLPKNKRKYLSRNIAGS